MNRGPCNNGRWTLLSHFYRTTLNLWPVWLGLNDLKEITRSGSGRLRNSSAPKISQRWAKYWQLQNSSTTGRNCLLRIMTSTTSSTPIKPAVSTNRSTIEPSRRRVLHYRGSFGRSRLVCRNSGTGGCPLRGSHLLHFGVISAWGSFSKAFVFCGCRLLLLCWLQLQVQVRLEQSCWGNIVSSYVTQIVSKECAVKREVHLLLHVDPRQCPSYELQEILEKTNINVGLIEAVQSLYKNSITKMKLTKNQQQDSIAPRVSSKDH